jgi:hypothetical protein
MKCVSLLSPTRTFANKNVVYETYRLIIHIDLSGGIPQLYRSIRQFLIDEQL